MISMDWSEKWAVYQADQIAFQEYETGKALRFAELDRFASRLAREGTHRFGLNKGDRIALLAENGLGYLVLFAAAQKAGWVLVPMNYRLAAPEIEFLVQDATPGLIIYEETFSEKLKNLELHSSSIPTWNWKAMQTCFRDEERQADFESVPIDFEDAIFILYTSGTTGFPKGAIYTHRMLFWNSINTALSLILNTESKTVNCMPPFHTGGWNVLTTPFFHHGGQTWLMKNFDPKGILELIHRERLSIFMGVPTMLKMIADLPEFESADLSSLLYVIVGGEPMPIPLIEIWESKGVAIRQGFGMTEAGPNLTSLHQDDAIRKKGSIGRPNFYVQTRIVNDQGADCSAHESGELWLKGPIVTPGYWQNKKATQKAFQDGWFKTGDRVLTDEEGYLFVVDRIKNMFISGGENVYPAEVERVLNSHPMVESAMVIGVSDDQWGETGKAILVVSETTSAETIQTYCQSQLAKFKVPKHYVFLEELPKNDTGKIDRKVIKERYG